MKRIAVLTALLFAALQIGYAQKVGLVLSGGGAKGAAHIGVTKLWKKTEYLLIT